MFVSFSKVIARFGHFRVGVGFRITKKNMYYMLFFLMFYYVFLSMWYMILLSFWLMYIVYYGLFLSIKWCVKKIAKLIRNISANKANKVQ